MTSTKEKDREILQRVKEKSDDDFEKSITYISAGALGLSMTFVEKIANIPNAFHLWLVVASWGFLTVTLLVNLLSHYLSSYYHEKSTEELDNNDPKVNEKIDSRNKTLRKVNIGTIITLILGIALLITFLSINLNNMSDENQNRETTTTSITPDSGSEIRGRTITKPSSTSIDSIGSSNNASQQTSNNNSQQTTTEKKSE